VDKERRRVALTAIAPGTERPPVTRRPKPGGRDDKEQRRPARPPRPQALAGTQVKPPKFQAASRPKPKPKPKPVKPITQAMVDGREPMRSFSDLLQFFKKKKAEPGTQSDKSS
jgi:uncharacterized protein